MVLDCLEMAHLDLKEVERKLDEQIRLTTRLKNNNILWTNN